MLAKTDTVDVIGMAECIRRCGLSPSTIENYRRDASKHFPKPVPNTMARVLFSVEEIDAWVATHPLPKAGRFRQAPNAIFKVPRR